MTHRKKVKWLIVFLVQNVHESEEIKQFMDQTLEELLDQEVDPSQIGIAGWISTTTVTPILERELDQKVNGKGPVHNFVVQLMPGPGNKRRLHVLRQLPSRAGLQQVAPVIRNLTLIRDLYEYEHIILTTWDHGSGFAFFTDPDKLQLRRGPASPAIKGKDAVVRHPTHDTPVHRLFKEGSLRQALKKQRKEPSRKLSDFRAFFEHPEFLDIPYGLTMDKLHKVIRTVFKRVDVIFMRNCFMQVFDSGYTLNDVADFLVASESIMWFPAYNYTIWLKAMLCAKGLTPKEVASDAIMGVTGAKGVEPRFRKDMAVFGNDLSVYPALNDAINRMTTQLIYFVKGNKGKLMAIRASITDVVRADFPNSGFQLIDAKWWFVNAGKLLYQNDEYQDALKDFLVLHRQTVGDRKVVGSKLRGNGYHESGFSLYFPKYPENIMTSASYYRLYYALHTPFKARFTKFSLWDEFIGYLFLGFKPHLLQAQPRPTAVRIP
jgi:hypothetical protein